MVITFNELRRTKDKLPSGSMQRIADELGIEADEVRNYFGGRHYEGGTTAGVHFEEGPDGGTVSFDDDTIYQAALRILKELE
ncbi:MAG: DNA-binding protein [Tidjanibacter sp.]|nr:DNA-binding protein [Rikenellaceae bacterium]MBQ8335335.1 DNA-binding protein [Tidjanibacter sp.]